MNPPALIRQMADLITEKGCVRLIPNLDLQMEVIEVEGVTFPLSISDPPNGYFCSPTVAYLDYAIEETRHFAAHRFFRALLAGLIQCCRPLLRATALDRQVQLNNWLFSTNPVPPISPQLAVALRDHLIKTHPDRAIVMRSLNTKCDQASIDALRDAGFALLPSRQIYLIDHRLKKQPTADMKRDQNLLKTTPYSIDNASFFIDADFDRAAELYRLLYIEKYSALNPNYTAAYLKHAHRIGLLQLSGLRTRDGRLDGVVGIFENGETTTAPLVGYDTALSQKLGLYRLLNQITINHGQQHGGIQNLSAGAAGFKRHRNAQPAIEYSAVYVGHLSRKSRVATGILRLILTHIGIPILRRFAL